LAVTALSIDGTLYPFQWGDLLSALDIFPLLFLIFVISFVEPIRRRDDPDQSTEQTDDER
jgi:hypothetical protein